MSRCGLFVMSLAACVGCVASATAQPVETITFTIEWDLPSIIQGETNTGAVYVNITPEIGTQTAWNSVPGKGQSAILEAYAHSIIDLVNVQNSLAGKLEWSVPGEVNLATKPGEPDGNGGISQSYAGQFPLQPNPNPIITNKVKILDLKWTGLEATQGEVIFATKATKARVFLDVNLSGWVTEDAVKIDGQAAFGYNIPATASVAGLAFAGLFAARRRRGSMIFTALLEPHQCD